MFPFQAEIFPLRMICSLHSAAEAAAAAATAASVALAWYLIILAAPLSLMSFEL